MRPASSQPSQGALPPAFGRRPQPSNQWRAAAFTRDISIQHESSQVFHTGTNIPAGGFDRGQRRNGAERSAQNSSFKNFVGQGVRA